MGYGWILQILIVVLFFIVAWWMISTTNNFGYRVSSKESALDILDKRLASGEITIKEYNKLKKEIQNGR